jgi:SAM-dependent methyltransferase
MTLERHRSEWEKLAEHDALWAVLTQPDKRGGRWSAEEFLATGEVEIAEVLAEVERLGRAARRRRALDFGCGAGRLTRALAGRFDTAVGVDISAAMVETAQRLNADVPGCEFRQNTTSDLGQFGDGEFDLVYTSLVLQHLPTRELVRGYVAELLRVAAPDGIVVFGLPDRISWPYRLGLSRRLYAVLRRLGVREETLLRRTPLTPMRMTAVPERDVREQLAALGADVLRTEVGEGGGVRTVRYFVARSASAR